MEISKDESLKLLGMFTLASEHYAKVREFEFAINRALGREDNYQDAIADALYSNNGSSSAHDFFTALKKEGIAIKDL